MTTKLSSTKSLDGAKGGTTKMFSKSGVQTSEPGVSARPNKASFDKAPIKGGKSGVMGKQGGVRPSESGKVTVAKSGVGNSKGFSVSGGKGHMAGPSGATPGKAQ